MEDRKELEQWLTLIHSRNPCLRDLNRAVAARWPGKSLTQLPPDRVSQFLEHALATLPDPAPGAVTADVQWLQDGPDRHLLPVTDPRYPWLLREIPDPPLVLFVRGDPGGLNLPCLSIVGSRNPTPQGRETAESFARQLARMGFTVASGLARGIDGSGHRGALAAGATTGVCAHGLDMVYPGAHESLAEKIAGTGKSALVSEFPTGTTPQRHRFPQRNRVISGMSLGTLVVEAGLRSGSLITANLAAEQNREVFAVPGPINSPQSRGCHDLIRNGATLVETVEDILQEISSYRGSQSFAEGCTTEGAGPTKTHAWFLEHMGYAPSTRDELARRSGLTSAEVSSMLLVLELEGWVEMCPGGAYVRVTRS